MSGSTATPLSWNPDMSYRGQRERNLLDPTNALEDYADGSIVTYYRIYSASKQPNHDYSPRIATAVKISNDIDFIDTNPRALDQVIWGLTHPNDVHPGIRSIVENSALVDLLLIRHFKAHGGIALPPLKAARDLQTAHEIVAAQEASAGLTWTTGRSAMHYPMWYAAPRSLLS